MQSIAQKRQAVKHAKTIVLILLIILAIAAGAAKVMKMPQELEFFGNAVGMNAMGVVILGALQLLSALLLLFVKTRLPGALLLDLTLIFSTAVLFIAGDIPKALMSLVPVILNSMLIFDLLVQRTRLSETRL